MKKIIIQTQQGINPQYKLWAQEAVQEMLKMFPEYRSSFKVEFDDNQTNGKDKISQQEFDLLPDNAEKKQYIKLKNGEYLVPHASTLWYLRKASQGNRRNKINAVDITQFAHLKREYLEKNQPDVILFSLLKEKISPPCYGYGIEGLNAVLSTLDCPDKEFFITIFMHEFGHILKATHKGRGHTRNDPDLGTHCTVDKCIMGESNYEALNQERLARKQNNNPPFCDECIAAMRDYLEKMPGLTKGLTISNVNDLPVLPHNNDNWKDEHRQFFTAAAQRRGLAYDEDMNNGNYKAQLTKPDGSTLDVEANNEYNLSVGARKPDGSATIPDYEDFADLARKAREKNCQMEFGDIRDDEYKARLLIACLEIDPPLKTKGAPHITPEFLNNLEPATKIRLNKAMTRQRQQQQTPPAPSPAPDPYEQKLAERIAELENQLKLGTITPQENAELAAIKLNKEHYEELEKAKQRTGNSIDPRSAEHMQATGLDTESYYYHSPRKEDAAWKLHLDVVPNRNDQTTKAVSELLEKLNIEHKIAHGGENGKGMTIYVGGYEDTLRLAKELNIRFGKEIAVPPVYTDQANEEVNFNKIVTGRFYLQNIFQTQYPHAYIRGITPSTVNNAQDDETMAVIFAAAQKEGVIDKQKAYNEVNSFRNPNIHDQFVFNTLEAYCAHKLYGKYLGEYYQGARPELLEQKLFGDALPPAGSPERAKWDKVATAHITKIENDYPNKVQKMQDILTAYTPVDFSKLPPAPRRHNNSNNAGRP